MLCGCHLLNLVVEDNVSCSIESKDFFGAIQKIHMLFSATVRCWNILKKLIINIKINIKITRAITKRHTI